MSEISLDASQVASLLERITPFVDDTYRATEGIPSADGGIASNTIGLIASAAVEGARVVADSTVAIMALTRETVSHFAANEENAAQELRDYAAEIEGA